MADIKFTLKADTDNFSAEIDSAMQEIRDLGQTMGATKKQLEDSFRELGRQSFQVGGDKAVEYFKEQVEQSTARVIELATQLNELQNTDGFDASSEEAKELTASLQEAREQAAQFQAAFVGANEASAEQMQNVAKNGKAIGDALNQIPGPLNGTVGGFRKLITAAKAFIATPIGAIIGALVAALSLLKSYFTGTAEGQAKMAKASAVMGSVLDSIKDVAIKLGKALSEAFDNPVEAVKKLGKAILDNLVNRIKGVQQMVTSLGGMVKSLLSADWDGLKQSAAEFADAQLKIYTGKGTEEWQERTEKMKAWRDEVRAAADEMGNLAEREFKLRQQRSKWQIKEANLDNKIAQARMKAYDEDATRGEQAQALEEQQRLITEKYEQQIKFAKEEYAITKKRNSLHESTIEDLEKEDELQANITKLEAQMNSELAGVERRRASASKAAREQEFNLLQEAKQLEIQIGEERLKMQDESLNKTMQQIELDRRRRQIELDTQKHQWEAAQGGELTKAQKEYIESMGKLINEAAATAGETAIFEKYADAAQKAMQQHAKSENEINLLKDQGREREAAEAERQRNEQALAYMQDVEGGLTPEFKMWIDSLGDMTLKTLESELKKAEESLTALKAKNASTEEIMAAEARIAALNKEVKAAQTDIQRGPKLTAYKNLNKVLGDAASGFEALGQTGNEAFDKIMQGISDVLGSVQSIIGNIQVLVESSIKGMEKTADEGAKAVKTVEKASVILAIIGAALSLAMKIKNMIADDSKQKALEESIKQCEKLRAAFADLHRQMLLDTSGNDTVFGDNMYSNLKQYTDGIKELTGSLEENRQTVRGLADNYYDFTAEKNGGLFQIGYATTDRGLQADEQKYHGIATSINEVANALANYKINIDNRGKFEKWFSKTFMGKGDQMSSIAADYRRKTGETLDLIGKSEEETYKRLQAFRDSDYFEKNADKDLKASLDEMLKNYESYFEAKGEIASVYKNWFGGMSDAFAESIKIGFTDGAKAGRESFKEQVNGMISDMFLQMTIGESMKQILEDASKEITEMQLEGATPTELANKAADTADKFLEKYDTSLAAYETLQDELEKRGFGIKDSIDGTLSGAIKGASQESIDLLSGYCNAVRIQQVDGINIMRKQLISLSGIEGNTRAINVGIQGFRTSMENILRTDGARSMGAVLN